MKWALAVAIATAILLPLTLGRWTPLLALGILLAIWVIAAGFVNLQQRVQKLRSTTRASIGEVLRQLPRGYWGMLLAHFGVGVFIVGVTLVRAFEVEKDVRMSIGDTVEASGYRFRLDALKSVQGPNYQATRGTINVMRGERQIATLYPEKRFYNVQQMPMTEAAIDTGFTRDLYVSLGEPLAGGAWVVRVYHKPFVDWIWGGAFLMALGGVLAITDRRYRLARREEPAPAPAQTPATQSA
jgi:cytochrome c-type biogenesis protein CcmF